MAKYNTKSTPKAPTEINFMGEKAFKLSDKEELVSTVMTTFLQDSYYENEKVVIQRIRNLISKVDPLFSAKLAIYARNEGNLRSVTHLISALIAKYISGSDWGKRFYNKIIIRPDDMAEILSCYAAETDQKNLKDIKKIPNSIKKGFKEALERLDAYQIDKYKMENKSIKLVDLVRLFHPKSQKNLELYKKLLNGESLKNSYSSKILEKEMSKVGQMASSESEKLELKEKAISSVVENINGMPIMNLIRNLRNILLYSPNSVEDACKQMLIKNKILNSRLLPFRFATAYSEIESLNYKDIKNKNTSEIVFEKEQIGISESEFNRLKKLILDSLENAIQISCLNIPKLEGNVAILIDHSGSVRGDAGGSSKVSAFSKTTKAMIGNLFGSMVAYNQDNVYIGLFGDKLISVPIDRTKKLLDFNKYSYNIGDSCGGSTEQGIYDFFDSVVKENKKVDNVIIFSDCQIGNKNANFTSWYGHRPNTYGPNFHEIFKKFRSINPQANVIVCNLNQSGGTSVFDKSQRILNIAGWSDKIFDIITSNCKGWDAMIKEIESIVI